MKTGKIKIIFLVAVILAINTTVIFAVNSGKPDTDTGTMIAATDKFELSLDRNVRFKALADNLKKKDLKEDDFYNQMAKYASFINIFKPSTAEIEYINALAASGDDLSKLIDIYGFWKDTDDDISMIKTIYDAYDPELAQSDYWVEEIYNRVTAYKTGVLNSEDIDEYIKQGLTRGDIVTANRLCRLGKLTIQQILEEKISGTSWFEIIDQLYVQAQNRDTSLIKSISTNKKERYKKIKDGGGILDAEFLAKRNGREISGYLDDLAAGNSLSGEKSQYYKESTDGLLENLRSQGLWDEPQDIKEKNQKAFKDLREKIKENGIPEEKIDSLKSEGYNELDILNASETAKRHKANIDQVIKEKEKGKTWEDISVKGVEQ